MTQENLFEAFQGTEPPLVTPPKRNRRKARENGAASAPAGAAPAPKKRGRKPKVVSETAPKATRGRKPRAEDSLRVDLATVGPAFVNMSLDDFQLVGKIAAVLLKQPKGARARIVAALGAVFA